MKIDDMRVGDFLHLLDCMQEECCEHKRCSECRYNDLCDDIDLPSIDSVSLRETIEGYAEANGLLDHMHYINDQRWIPCSDRLPDKDGSYLAHDYIGNIDILDYADGWNCYRMPTTNEVFRGREIKDVVAWMPLPEPYRGEKA